MSVIYGKKWSEWGVGCEGEGGEDKDSGLKLDSFSTGDLAPSNQAPMVGDPT